MTPPTDENIPNGASGTSTTRQVTVDKSDLKALSVWVKEVVFEGVKFLYDAETELKVDGRLYEAFTKSQCRKGLQGLKDSSGDVIYERMYLEKLWEEANHKSNNLVASGIERKRTTSYTAIQGKFVDLCKICSSKTAVLPSLESFEMGLEIPVVYMVFYDFFFQASVGIDKWKKESRETSNSNAALGSVTAESFAMIVLKNNYFAWLLEAKKALPGLITEYCPENRRLGKKSVGQVWLHDLEIEIMETPVMKCCFVKEGHEKYHELRERREEATERAVEKAAENMRYKTMMFTLINIGDNDMDHIPEEIAITMTPQMLKNAKVQKKREILKPLKWYTITIGGEAPFKGWSRRTAVDTAKYNRRLRDPQHSIKCNAFKVLYKEFFPTRNNLEPERVKKRKERAPVEYDDVWEL